MGLFDWIKRRKPREEQKAELVMAGPLDYGSRHPQLERRADPSIEDLPIFHYWHARAMLFDPVVRFGLTVRNSAISCAEIEVEGDSPAVVAFVKKQWETLWSKYSSKLAHTKRYGYGGYEVLFREERGMLTIDGLREFSPMDVRPLLVRGQVCGLSVKSAGNSHGKARLLAPRGLLCTFDSEFNDPYGRSILRRSFSPWWEKWMDGGAKKTCRLRMIKDAYIGDTLTYPMNQKIVLPDGTEVPWRDIIRELGENRLAGGIMAVPAIYDNQNRELVKYTPARDTGNPEGIWTWVENLDIDIWRGMDVFEEVIQASETGSGYSGRSVPLMMFLGSCNDEVKELVENIDQQCLRPLAWLNFGCDPAYTIKPKDLIETFAAKTAGNAMGGGAMGGAGGAGKPPAAKGGAGPYVDYHKQDGSIGKRRNPKFGGGDGAQFDEDGHKFSCALLHIPFELADDIRSWLMRVVDHRDLAADGFETQPHITVKYGLHDDSSASLREVLRGLGPLAVRLGRTSIFPARETDSQRGGDVYDVLKIDVHGEALRKLNVLISKSLPCTNTYPVYVPHLTLAYLKPGAGQKYVDQEAFEGRGVVFNHLVFSSKSGGEDLIDLTGTVQFREDTGTRWITIGGRAEGDKQHVGGFPIMIDGSGKILRGGPASIRGKNVSDLGEHFRRENAAREKKRKDAESFDFGSNVRPTPKIPSENTPLGRVARESVGDDPHDIAELVEVVEDIWKQRREHIIEENNALDNLLGNFVKDHNRGAFTRKLQRAEDPDQILYFDEMLDMAATTYPGLIQPEAGQGTFGGNDPEYLLFQRLKRGKRKIPARHDEEIVAEALEYLSHAGSYDHSDLHREMAGVVFAEDGSPYESSYDELFEIGSGRNRAILAALSDDLKKKRPT